MPLCCQPRKVAPGVPGCLGRQLLLLDPCDALVSSSPREKPVLLLAVGRQMTTALQRSQAADKAANMEIMLKKIYVLFLLTIIISGQIASVS